MNFSEFRVWFDDRFTVLLKEKIDQFISLSTSPDITAIASYAMTIAQEGKRFRPFLIYSASGIATDTRDDHFLLLASVEMLHIFALIHDDIMDDAQSRHGVVCAHKQFTDRYGAKTAEAVGILLGDIIFAWAYECLFAYTKNIPESRERIIEEFVRLVAEVTHGQLLDVISPTQEPLDERAITEKMMLKTARYSFVQPMRLGYVLAGDIPADQVFAERFGIALGIAFQLQDDLLDSAPSEQTGKTRFIDIQSKQQTILSWYMTHEASLQAQEQFKTFFGATHFSEAQEQALADLLVSSGAYDYVKTQCASYFTEATNTVDTMRSTDREAWHGVIELVQQRKK